MCRSQRRPPSVVLPSWVRQAVRLAPLLGVVGAVVGLPAAIFTFGLSIPVCAVVGSAVGGGTGATVGGTTGAVGGGAAGYYGYKHKDNIRDTISATRTMAKEYHGYAEQKVY